MLSQETHKKVTTLPRSFKVDDLVLTIRSSVIPSNIFSINPKYEVNNLQRVKKRPYIAGAARNAALVEVQYHRLVGPVIASV